MPISIVRRHQNFVPALQKEVLKTYRRKKYIFKIWRFKGFLRPLVKQHIRYGTTIHSAGKATKAWDEKKGRELRKNLKKGG